MPGIKGYPSDLDEVDKIAQGERKERIEFIDLVWRYYRGEHKKPLKVRIGQPDDNVIINLCGKLIDTGVALLFGQGVQFELAEGKQTPQEDYLDSVWRANNANIFLNDIGLSGFVTGHVFIKIVPVEGQPPRFINLDASRILVFWAEDDIDTVLFYTISAGKDKRQDIVRDGDTWLVRDLERDARGQWAVTNEVRWGFTWPPILDWKNLPNPNRYYGRSDLEHADLNDAVNFVASNTNRIIRYHAHPKTIGTGMLAKDVQETAVDSFWTVPTPEARIFNLEMQSDLASSMAFLNFLRTAFFSLGAGVDLNTLQDRLGQITNFGLRVLFKDALDRLELKRSLYGEALIELNRRVLEMAGYGSDNICAIHWPDPLPQARRELVEGIRLERELGLVSKETAAVNLGHDWEVEQERMAAEAEGEDSIGARLLRAFERGR